MHAEHAGWAILTDVAYSEAGSVVSGAVRSGSATWDLLAQDGRCWRHPAIPLSRRRDGRPTQYRTAWSGLCRAPRQRPARPLFVGSNPLGTPVFFFKYIVFSGLGE